MWWVITCRVSARWRRVTILVKGVSRSTSSSLRRLHLLPRKLHESSCKRIDGFWKSMRRLSPWWPPDQTKYTSGRSIWSMTMSCEGTTPSKSSLKLQIHRNNRLERERYRERLIARKETLLAFQRRYQRWYQRSWRQETIHKTTVTTLSQKWPQGSNQLHLQIRHGSSHLPKMDSNSWKS